MKHHLLLLFVLLQIGCTQSQPHETTTTPTAILPLKITLKGQLKAIEDVGLLTPDIQFQIDTNVIKVRVGVTESYRIAYQRTALDRVFELFQIEDFQLDDHYYDPYFKYMHYMETEKEIEGQTYVRKLTRFKRRDIPIKYLDMDTTKAVHFAILSNYLNELAIDLLRDRIDKDSMIVAYSIKEALAVPERVYKLNLRNQRVTSLPPEIGQLVNLRVLDISGSWIKRIPPEIEHCVELRSIIANASRLSDIPSTLVNLKQLRNINFGACRIKTLPDNLGEIESLWSLSLAGNQLTDLPESISQLKNVMIFTVDENKLSEFPHEVLGLESVSNLWMHDNHFKTIPPEIRKLKKLSHLLVDAHEIENIEEIKALIPEVRIIDESKR